MKSHLLTLFFIFFSTAILLIPATVSATLVFDFVKIDNDGHLIYNATNIGNESTETIDNYTMFIHWNGSSVFTGMNYVDVWTKVIVRNLTVGKTASFKTEDQVFKVRPLFRKPVMFFGNYEIKTINQEYTWMALDHVTFLLLFIHYQYDYNGPYYP